MILFHDKDLKRIDKEYETGWNFTQRKNCEGSGKIDLIDFPVNARYASLYQGDKKFKDVLVEDNSRSGNKISTGIKTLEALFSHYRIPENWHGWDKLPLSYVLADLIYGFETIRKSTIEEYVHYIEKSNVGIGKLYDGDIHLDYYEGANSGLYYYENGYITFAFDCGDCVSQRWVRWTENVGEKVFIEIQSVSSDVPFTTSVLPNFTGVPKLTARTGIENESCFYGVKIASDKRYVAVRFNLKLMNFNPIMDFAKNTVYDAQGKLVERTIYGFTPVVRAFEVVTRKNTEFTLKDAPVLSELVDLEFGGETLWDALKKLNDKYSFDFQTYIDSRKLYFQFAASLVINKTRKAEYIIRQGDIENRQLNNTTVKELKTNNQKVNVLHCFGKGEYQEQLYVRIPATGTGDGLSQVEAEFSDSGIETLTKLTTAGNAKLLELRGDNSPTFDVETSLNLRLFDKVTIISPVNEAVYDATIEEEELSYRGNKLSQKFGVGGFLVNPFDALVQKRKTNTPYILVKAPFGIRAISGTLEITVLWDGSADSYSIKWKEASAPNYNFRKTIDKSSIFKGLDSAKTYLFSVVSVSGEKLSNYSPEITVQPLPIPSDGQPSYLHIAYGSSSTGSGFSRNPSGKTYMGVYSDSNATDSENPADYAWSLVQGPQGNTGATGSTGATGAQGTPGANGTVTKYLGLTQSIPTTRSVVITKGPRIGAVDANIDDWVLYAPITQPTPIVWTQGYLYLWNGSAWGANYLDPGQFVQQYSAALIDIMGISALFENDTTFNSIFAHALMAQKAMIDELQTKEITFENSISSVESGGFQNGSNRTFLGKDDTGIFALLFQTLLGKSSVEKFWAETFRVSGGLNTSRLNMKGDIFATGRIHSGWGSDWKIASEPDASSFATIDPLFGAYGNGRTVYLKAAGNFVFILQSFDYGDTISPVAIWQGATLSQEKGRGASFGNGVFLFALNKRILRMDASLSVTLAFTATDENKSLEFTGKYFLLNGNRRSSDGVSWTAIDSIANNETQLVCLINKIETLQFYPTAVYRGNLDSGAKILVGVPPSGSAVVSCSCINGVVFCATVNDKFWKSTDMCTTWVEVAAPCLSANTYFKVFDDLLICQSKFLKAFYTSDYGLTWLPIPSTADANSFPIMPSIICIDEPDIKRLIVLTSRGGFYQYVTTDMSILGVTARNGNKYDTGWIPRTVWQSTQLPSNKTLNAVGYLEHRLGLPYESLNFKVLFNTENNGSGRTWTEDFKGYNTYGHTIIGIDLNRVLIKTCTDGLISVGSITVDTEYQAAGHLNGNPEAKSYRVIVTPNTAPAYIKGDTGLSGTMKIGTVVSGDSPSSANVTNTGTASGAVLDFTLPKGDPGTNVPNITGLTEIAEVDRDNDKLIIFDVSSGSHKQVSPGALTEGVKHGIKRLVARTMYTGNAVQTINDDVITFGQKTAGSLGNGAPTAEGTYSAPFVIQAPDAVNAGGIGPLISMDMWAHGGCALYAPHHFYTFGYNSDGGLGLGNTTNVAVLTKADGGITEYRRPDCVGYTHNAWRLWVKKTSGYWAVAGYNGRGACGLGNVTTPVVNFTEVQSLGLNVRELWNLGTDYGCTFVQKTDGSLWAAGSNDHGQLGITGQQNSFVDVSAAWGVAPADIVLSVQGGFGYYNTAANGEAFVTMFISSDGGLTGRIRSAGFNSCGVFGDGTTTNRSVPTAPIGLPADIVKYKITPAGSVSSCYAVTQSGLLYVWGYNAQGQLGQPACASINTPKNILLNNSASIKVADIFVSGGAQTYAYHGNAFVQTTTGRVFSTGWNANGECGQGDTVQPNWFKEIPFNTTKYGKIIDMATNGYNTQLYHTFLTDKDNCFGVGYNGRQGLSLTGEAVNKSILTYMDFDRQGHTGDKGNAATVEIGNVTAGTTPSSAAVTNRGDKNAAIFDFILPKGDPGISTPDILALTPATDITMDDLLYVYDKSTASMKQVSVQKLFNPFPIGSIFPQLLGQATPGDLYPGTTWSDVSAMYQDLFFRVRGSGTSNAKSIGQSTVTIAAGTTTQVINTVAAHELVVGDPVLSGGEVRYVSVVNSVNQITVGSAFTVIPFGIVYIGQGHQLLSHIHHTQVLLGYNSTSGSANQHNEGYNRGAINKPSSVPASDGVYPIQTGNETRPANISIVIWKRIS